MPDLSAATTRAAVRQTVDDAFPGDHQMRQAIFAGQLWALRSRIQPDDLVVMPMKSTQKIALGICASGYSFRANDPDATRRHTIGVDWKRQDISRAAIKDDLLNTLGGAMTIFQAQKNQAEVRLRCSSGNGS